MYEREYTQAPKQKDNKEKLTGAHELNPGNLVDHIPSFSDADPHATLEIIKKLEAIVVFEGNTVIKNNLGIEGSPKIKPTSFNDADDFGPLGGRSRTLASACIAASLGAGCPQIIFAGGNPEKKIKSHSGIEHSGAETYKSSYLDALERIRAGLEDAGEAKAQPRTFVLANTFAPETLILDDSENSYGDVMHSLELAEEKGWKSLGFLSNQYHLPRLQQLFEKVQKENAPRFGSIELTLLGAEDTILNLSSNTVRTRYRTLFMSAYAEDGMQKRIAAEQAGIAALTSGVYKHGEGKGVTKL